MKVYQAVGLINSVPIIMTVPDSNPIVIGTIDASVLVCGADTNGDNHIVKLAPDGSLLT